MSARRELDPDHEDYCRKAVMEAIEQRGALRLQQLVKHTDLPESDLRLVLPRMVIENLLQKYNDGNRNTYRMPPVSAGLDAVYRDRIRLPQEYVARTVDEARVRGGHRHDKPSTWMSASPLERLV